MKCPKCNAKNQEKAVICVSCGESLLPDSILRRQFYTGDPYPENLPLVKLASLFLGKIKRRPLAVFLIVYVMIMSIVNSGYPVTP